MADRSIAEQKLCDDLFKAGIITADKEFIVRRLDFSSPFYCFFGNEIIGQVQYDGNINKFYDFKGSHIIKRDKKIVKNDNSDKEYSIIDFLKVNKKARL